MSKEEKIIDNTILDSKVLSDSDLDQVSGGQMHIPGDNPMGGGMMAHGTANIYASSMHINNNVCAKSVIEKNN